ncbi:hypothetical protein [Methanosphaera sp.]|uniref:hypothetical protein n=1 Tax=Methanosphaera sp. TaxID=2666342 RepID=UPI0025DA591F|nr:hypothetical protein [Methanosphaera sp.]
MIRYVKTDKGIIDTDFLFPHMECYILKEDGLYVEEILGRVYKYAEVIDVSNRLEDLLDESAK